MQRRHRRRRGLPIGRVGALVAVTLVAFLYYRPLSTYLETRHALGERKAAVETLQAKRAGLEARLERATSTVALARQARRIGLVRPGEQLFIVKGISRWRSAHEPAAP